MFNNLHFTFADWWGRWARIRLRRSRCIRHEPHQDAYRRRSFGFNSGDSTDRATDTFVYALNGKWEISDGSRWWPTCHSRTAVRHQFIAVRTERVPAQITVDFNAGDGIPSWHFNDDAEMLDPALWTVGSCFQNRAGRVAPTRCNRWRLPSWAIGVFKLLSFGVRYDDRDARIVQPTPVPSRFLGGTVQRLPEGMIRTSTTAS